MKAIKLLSLCLIIGMSSCGDDDINYDQIMIDYMADAGWTGQPTVDGMYYVIIEPGGEEKPKSTDAVIATYKGYYTDGVEFDSGANVSFNLDEVIEGWTIGMTKFGKGGKGHLLIPPALAYGDPAPTGIRSKAILIFDVELVDF